MSDFDRTALERLQEYLDFKKIPAARLEKMAGLANGYIRKNKGSLSSVKLADILSVLPDLNGDWLLTGRGEMLIDDMRHVPHQSVTVQDGQYIEQGRQSDNGTFTGTGNIIKERVNVEKIEFEEEDPTDLSSLRKALFRAKERIKELENEIAEIRAEKDSYNTELNDALRTVHSLTKENQALRGKRK